MGDETYSVSNQRTRQESQEANESHSRCEEDDDDAIENIDAGSNYQFNSQDMEMILFYQVQENRVNLHDFIEF